MKLKAVVGLSHTSSSIIRKPASSHVWLQFHYESRSSTPYLDSTIGVTEFTFLLDERERTA